MWGHWGEKEQEFKKGQEAREKVVASGEIRKEAEEKIAQICGPWKNVFILLKGNGNLLKGVAHGRPDESSFWVTEWVMDYRGRNGEWGARKKVIAVIQVASGGLD